MVGGWLFLGEVAVEGVAANAERVLVDGLAGGKRGWGGGVSVVALVREYGVSRVAIRTTVADLLPGCSEQSIPAFDVADAPQPVRIEAAGKIARNRAGHDCLGEAERRSLVTGREVSRGYGVSSE